MANLDDINGQNWGIVAADLGNIWDAKQALSLNLVVKQMSQTTFAGWTIGVIGLGLIGGSMAKALKKYTDHVVLGCDNNPQTAALALEQGAVDRIISPEELSACDLILAALYPQQTVNFVRQNLPHFKKGCILTDLCGVKRYPIDQLSDLCAAQEIILIGGHPMAGRECWGFSGATAELYQNASMILTPDEHTPKDALAALEAIFYAIGFSRMTYTTPAAHDSMIAFTSQLAHVVSSAYIKSPRAREHSGFSAGSYKDLTRVAKLNPQMWTELFLENGDDLIKEIDEIILHLTEYRTAISESNSEQLFALLEDGRRIKEELDQ